MADEKKESEKYSQERRRRKYIKPLFQRRFILQFLSLIILGLIAFSISVYLYSQQTLTTAFINSKLRVMSTGDFLLPALLVIALVITAVVSFMTGLRLLLFSHKIAGPLYRLEKSAEAIGGGDLKLSIRLRSDDELQDFAQTMDGMVRDLRSWAVQIKRQNDKLRELLQRASQVSGIPKDLLQALQAAQKQLDEAISHFRV